MTFLNGRIQDTRFTVFMHRLHHCHIILRPPGRHTFAFRIFPRFFHTFYIYLHEKWRTGCIAALHRRQGSWFITSGQERQHFLFGRKGNGTGWFETGCANFWEYRQEIWISRSNWAVTFRFARIFYLPAGCWPACKSGTWMDGWGYVPTLRAISLIRVDQGSVLSTSICLLK